MITISVIIPRGVEGGNQGERGVWSGRSLRRLLGSQAEGMDWWEGGGRRSRCTHLREEPKMPASLYSVSHPYPSMGREGDRQDHGGAGAGYGVERGWHLCLKETRCSGWRKRLLGKLNTSVTFIKSELKAGHLLGEDTGKEGTRGVETQAQVMTSLLE